MATIWVREFTGGLDTRRLAETTHGGALIKGEDGHINRGGDFEKRPKFDPIYDLPAGKTKNLAATSSSLVAFGDVDPPTMPAGVTYQRLQHPDGATALSRVLSCDRYAGKLYVAAEFADGGRYHFYDGVRVDEWYDGRARATLAISGGVAGSNLSMLKVNGVSIIGGTVNWATSDVATVAAIATSINSAVSSPDYTATADGTNLNIVAATSGTGSNDLVITYTVSGLTVSPASGAVKLAGGVDTTNAAAASCSIEVTGGTNNVANKLTALMLNGVDILGSAVQHTGDNSTTASAIATQIGSYTSTPDYSATASGAVVTIKAVDNGAALNGKAPAPTLTGDFTVGNIQALSGGVYARSVYVPGTFVKTVKSRVHSVSGPNGHFSGIKAPTSWTTDAVGAGFTDLSTNAEESEDMKAIGVYQGWIAYFAERCVQIWTIDSDPVNNKQQQILSNTGTPCPRSVTKFGDNDLFYLDESGVRSIRARDASNAAATTDMGTPIDSLVTDKLRGLSATDRNKVIGLINPVDKRFWLIFPDQIFVFTWFESSKINAWSIYNPTYFDANGVKTSFTIDDAVVFKRRVYLRGADKVFCFGGLSTGIAKDKTSAVAWLPYLDGGTPTVDKTFTGFDAACRGEWKVSAGYIANASGLNVSQIVAVINDTTFTGPSIDIGGVSSHISVRFESQGDGEAILSACAIHYQSEQSDIAGG